MDGTIGNWDVTQLARYVRDMLTNQPVTQLPVLSVDSLRVRKQLVVDDQSFFQSQQQTRIVGGNGQPAFQNAWVAISTQPPRFFKDALGVVHLAGAAQSGTTGTTIFTLPPGFRPVYQAIFPVRAGGATVGTVVVNADGTVVHETGTNTLIALDSISFKSSTNPQVA